MKKWVYTSLGHLGTVTRRRGDESIELASGTEVYIATDVEAFLDVILPSWRLDSLDCDIELSALTMQRRRIEQCEEMLRRCELWLSTHPEGKKMQEAIRGIFKK